MQRASTIRKVRSKIKSRLFFHAADIRNGETSVEAAELEAIQKQPGSTILQDNLTVATPQTTHSSHMKSSRS